MKVTKRDILFFLAGMVAFLLVETVRDWENNKAAFREGFEHGSSNVKK